jgi:hypothetical protein
MRISEGKAEIAEISAIDVGVRRSGSADSPMELWVAAEAVPDMDMSSPSMIALNQVSI